MSAMLQIKNLSAKIKETVILKKINLTLKSSEIQVIMGPNGSGKSTLAKVLMGHPNYKLVSGEISFQGKNITKEKPEKRAILGMFLAWQNPREIAGVTFSSFLRMAQKKVNPKKNLSLISFREELEKEMTKINLPANFQERYVNNGFSGGEKKKAEIVQMKMLDPKVIILDEIDSGLDVDALKLVAKTIQEWRVQKKAILLITHYERLLKYLKPDYVHLMINGEIVKSGKKDFASKVIKDGYSQFSKPILKLKVS